MPELPEVETVRRTVAAAVIGRPLGTLTLHRADVLRDPDGLAPRLAHRRVVAILRHGKQLALHLETDAIVCVHLGMTGQLRIVPSPPLPPRSGDGLTFASAPTDPPLPIDPHVHLAWTLPDQLTLHFRDPRRFGGVWLFRSQQDLRRARWGRLGPDALVITPTQLHAALTRTTRELKAALLDQHLVAGLGNIYVDELLFAVGLHPQRPAHTVDRADGERLVRAMRRILGRAIDAGGSTLRDYVDARGRAGGFQAQFKAYGRFGQPCPTCRRPLDRLTVAGRTTTACAHCQATAPLRRPDTPSKLSATEPYGVNPSPPLTAQRPP